MSIHLTSKDFVIDAKDNVRIKNPSLPNIPGILLVWANWCPHCTSFLPTYTSIAADIGSEFLCVDIEHTELKKNPQLSRALDVKSFPTIKFFDQSGKVIGTYQKGDRSKNALLNYICKVYHHCINYH